MAAVGSIIYIVLWLFIILMLVRFVMDWVQVFAREWRPSGPLLVVLEVIYSTTDPPIRAVRKVLPMVRIGGMGLDLSPMVVLIVCYILLAINSRLFLSAV